MCWHCQSPRIQASKSSIATGKNYGWVPTTTPVELWKNIIKTWPWLHAKSCRAMWIMYLNVWLWQLYATPASNYDVSPHSNPQGTNRSFFPTSRMRGTVGAWLKYRCHRADDRFGSLVINCQSTTMVIMMIWDHCNCNPNCQRNHLVQLFNGYKL